MKFRKFFGQNTTLNPKAQPAAKTNPTAGARALDRAELITKATLPGDGSAAPETAPVVQKKALEQKKPYAEMLVSKAVKVNLGDLGKAKKQKGKPKVGLGGAIYSGSDLMAETPPKSVRTLKKS